MELMYGTTAEVQLDIYVQCGRYICSGAYVSNVKYMYTSAAGHIIDCIELIYWQFSNMCTYSNMHMWHIYDISEVYLLLAHIWL